MLCKRQMGEIVNMNDHHMETQFEALQSEAIQRVNANENQATIEIQALVRRVESLYDQIDSELAKNRHQTDECDDSHVEMLSQEIEELCDQVDAMPASDVPGLKAKVTLNLSLMSKSCLDEEAILQHSDKILEAMEEFKEANTLGTLLRTG